MNLAVQQNPNRQGLQDLSLSERAKLACRDAKQLEKFGEYEAAHEALFEFWPERHDQPKLDGLDERIKAEVLLRVGALAGWLGSSDQTESSQEAAKNLLTQSRERFHQLGDAHKEAEAHGELGLCYWREGALDEARVQLRAALHLLPEGNHELTAVILIRAGIVEASAGRSNEALRFYERAAPDVERSGDDALKGSFHISVATLFTRLASVENRQDYSDRALIEYGAASFHFEEVGNERAVARVENCLAFLYFTLGQHDDAHQHLDRARGVSFHLGDIGMVAHVDETRARVLLGQERLMEAERVVRSAIRTFEKGSHQALLAEALTTHGVITARMGNYARARVLLQRAFEIARTAGDLEGAGRAQLSLIEELAGQTPTQDMISLCRLAIELLRDTQDSSSRKRLMNCAERVFKSFEGSAAADQQPQATTWDDFSFKQHIHEYERRVIERALRDAGGSVTHAARLLGFKHHHSLISLLNTRHKELLTSRSAAHKRRRHLFSDSVRKRTDENSILSKPVPNSSQISILHVQDDKVVAELVEDIISDKGIYVHSCVGTAAIKLLGSDRRFDAIIFDNELSERSGLELVLRARSLSHRRHTPIILIASDDCEKEAWRAGVDAFLLKSKGVDKISSTIDRLFKNRAKKTD